MDTLYQSPIGVLQISGDEKGLTRIMYADETIIPDAKPPAVLRPYIRQLDEYFNYNRIVFDMPFKMEGTDFQKSVWQKVFEIPFGKTATYMDIALQLGGKDVIRAVGSAIAKNHLNIVIPCHRIIGSNGELTGYTGGLKRKEWLLNFENKVKQGNLFYNTNYKLL